MRIKFKSQAYQTAAVEAVVDCFKGQPKLDAVKYRMDTGASAQDQQAKMDYGDADNAFKNAAIQLDEAALLHNIQQIQSRQNLPVNQSLTEFSVKNERKNELEPVKAKYTKLARAISPVHLDVEMETGTGKTYCYIKTIFEMNQRYGWSKFIIVVPSIAIREGVTKSLQITADHFAKDYQWAIISGPEGHDAQLESKNEKIVQLVGTTEGEYQLELTVSNSRGESSSQMIVQVDNGRKPASEINFVDDIKPLLQNQLYDLRSCQSCHNPVTGAEGIPIYYDISNVNLYADVRARVNLNIPIDSQLLLKPTRYQHGGGVRFELKTTLGLESYNTILQWVIAGAPCGIDNLICP